MNLRRLIVTSMLVAVLGLVAAACGGDSGAPEEGGSSGARSGTVVIAKDSKFSPSDLTVRPGQTVTWEFEDRFVRHDVVGDGFRSERKRSGTFTHTFDKAGSYPYRCTLHSGMTGTITVSG